VSLTPFLLPFVEPPYQSLKTVTDHMAAAESACSGTGREAGLGLMNVETRQLTSSCLRAAPMLKKIAVPKPGPDEVLVHLRYSGVCHTDLHVMKGDWPLHASTPYVGGHEGAGVVVAKGSQVADSEVRLGDLAGIKWLNGSCLSSGCSFCLAGDESLCPKARLSGATVDGTFQQYAVAKAAHIARLPPDCDLAAVAPILCAGITVYRGLKESRARPGQSVAIVGAAGGLGSLALQFAGAMGLRPIAIDASSDDENDDRNKKAHFCKSLGALSYIDAGRSGSEDVVSAVRDATADGLGPHAVLLLPTHEAPFLQATQYVRSGGTVVCIGLPAHARLHVPVFDMVVRMICVRGSYVGNRQDTAEALDFFRQGLVKAPVQVVPMKDLKHVYESLQRGTVVGRYVLNLQTED
jgi:alcohol dehydrogenase, propanol-preferring